MPTLPLPPFRPGTPFRAFPPTPLPRGVPAAPAPVGAVARAPAPVPFMPGAPWSQFRFAPPAVGVQPPVPAAAKPFVNRVQGDDVDPRLRRFSEAVSNIFNSLIAQGKLVQTSPDTWELRA